MTSEKKREPEFEGPIWKHPYAIYIWVTALLFCFLLVIAYVGYKSGVVPTR